MLQCGAAPVLHFSRLHYKFRSTLNFCAQHFACYVLTELQRSCSESYFPNVTYYLTFCETFEVLYGIGLACIYHLAGLHECVLGVGHVPELEWGYPC